MRFEATIAFRTSRYPSRAIASITFCIIIIIIIVITASFRERRIKSADVNLRGKVDGLARRSWTKYMPVNAIYNNNILLCLFSARVCGPKRIMYTYTT
jgi:hypothetical protein